MKSIKERFAICYTCSLTFLGSFTANKVFKDNVIIFKEVMYELFIDFNLQFFINLSIAISSLLTL